VATHLKATIRYLPYWTKQRYQSALPANLTRQGKSAPF